MAFNDTVGFMDEDGNTTTSTLISRIENKSIPDGCIKVRFDALGYIPWDNPDNVVSAETELIARRVPQNMIPFMLLIGGPANVINMAVFFKQDIKDRVNLCLFALSLSDFIYLVTSIFLHGEQVYLQFITEETYGPFVTTFINANLTGFLGFQYVSYVLAAIIASERCFCVISPLKFQTLFRTRTMAVIIIFVYLVVDGLFFIVVFRHRIGCVYDLSSGAIVNTPIAGELYLAHQDLVDNLSGFVFGLGLPGGVIVIMSVTTITTAIKLRQLVTWRSETSSSLSPREVALTRMLIGNSIFFIACVIPDALFRIACLIQPEMNIGRRNQNLYLSFEWFLNTFSYINATCNFFIFFAMGSRYRETFWAIFKRQNQPEKGK